MLGVYMRFFSVFLTLSALVTCFTAPAYAQLQFLADGYEDKFLKHDEGPGATKSHKKAGKVNKYIYEVPTVKALSHTYWAINLYDLEDDRAVDGFIQMNECEIYTAFSTDEFEWQEIRNASREFIRLNKNDFPTRFEFVIPLKLKNYDEKRHAFQLQEDYKMASLRRFEVLASDARKKICDIRNNRDYYPRAMVLEFSRPFSLTHIPMPQAVANDYIKRRLSYMKQRYDSKKQTKRLMYSLRNAYLFIKVKVFTHGKILPYKSVTGGPVIQLMAILEGYEIYEDSDKENLFFSQTFVTKRNKGTLDVQLKEQYKTLREMSKNGGVLSSRN
ncbi:MAG: DUF4852 domain-containing protein [Alphaproteobacteria bacterium]